MPRNADVREVSAYVDFQLDGETLVELIAEFNPESGMLRLSRMDCGTMQAEVGGGEIEEVFFECFKSEVEVDMNVRVRAEWVSRVSHTVEFSDKAEYDEFMRNPAAYMKSERDYYIVEDVDVNDIDDVDIVDIDVLNISE